MDIHLLNALGITNCALFKYTDSHELECLTPELPWLSQVVTLDANNNLEKQHIPSIFLDDFFLDANEVWKGSNSFSLSSGFWTEQNESHLLRLEALAINSESGARYLVVKNVEEQFDEKQRTLQAARELLLSHHEIVGQHEYIRHKLNNVLRKNTRLQKLVPPIQQAIHDLDTGVVILDNDGALVLDNKASHRLLYCNSSTPSSIRISELIKDIGAPPTFLPALVEKKTPWQGELFWQPVDEYKVWLQVTIHPVLQGDQLTHWVYLLTDITHIHGNGEGALIASGMDSLTKVANRNLFIDTVKRSVNEQSAFKLFLIDICGFKKINESLSYQSGDEILKTFALRIQSYVGNNGFIARIGSNEFALVKRSDTFRGHTSEDYAEELIKKLTQTYNVLNGSEPHLGVNVGIANFPSDCNSAESLLQCADIALQAAKYQGRNNVLIYSEELHKQHNASNELERQLRKAIEGNELTLFLQPIVNLATGKIVKCEALARWKTSSGEFIPPDVFIPLAEKSDLIFAFGEWLINEACEAIEAIKAANLDIRLAINISGRQVTDLALLTQIKNALDDHKLSGSSLSIELTESVFVESLDSVSILLNELRDMGITVSIDDFGTGFSSLVYLKKLPIDELKIDRSFVSELEENTEDQAIVQAILSLAHNLNIKIIAEGIETKQQQEFLKSHDCTYGQGYLYQRPVAISEFVSSAKKLR